MRQVTNLTKQQVMTVTRGRALQAAFLNSFHLQSNQRQTVGYAFYNMGAYNNRPSLCVMDDYGSVVKVETIPHYFRNCKRDCVFL